MTTDRSIVAPAPRSRAWSALTDLREFSQWFNVECNSGSFSPGDRVDMVCTTPGYEGVKFYLVVEEMTAEQRFGWRWHPGGRSLARISLRSRSPTWCSSWMKWMAGRWCGTYNEPDSVGGASRGA